MISSFTLLLSGLWEALAGIFTAAETGDRGQEMDPNG